MTEATEPRVPRVAGGKLYPLSFQQQTTCLVEMSRPNVLFNPHYLIHVVLRLRGRLEYEALRRAFDDVVQRQAALRTRLALTPEEDLVQEELPEAHHPLSIHDAPLAEEEVEPLVRKLAATPIPFDTPPFARASVHRLGEEEHLLFLGLHHFVCDAPSLFIALDELARAYEARLRGERRPPLPLSYGEYTLWQARDAEPRMKGDIESWRRYFAGLKPYAVRQDLPFHPAPTGVVGAEGRFPLLDAEAFAAFERFALRQRTSTFVALLAAFHVALGSRTDSEDRLAITYFDQRDHPATRDMVGYFLRPTPLRSHFGRDVPLRELLPGMTRLVIDAHRRAYVPLHHLLDAMPAALPSLLGQEAPWFFVFQYLPWAERATWRFGEAQGGLLRSGANTVQEPGFSLRLRRGQVGELRLRLGYDPAHWRADSMHSFAHGLARVLEALREDPSRTPAELLAAVGAW